MPAQSPDSRALVAQIAAHERWANCADRSAATAPARRAFDDRFERQVDPDGTLDPAERARRAAHKRKAYFLALSLKSAQARRKAAGLTEVADRADHELDAMGGTPAA